MQSAVPHRLFDRLTLGLVIILVAAPVTMLELTRPSLQAFRTTAEDLAVYVPHSSAPASKPATHVTLKPAPAPAAKPATVAATPATAANTATTTSFVHLRAAKSVSSPIVTDLGAGTVVQLRDDADATWQGVTYQGKTGYIYRAYLQYQPAAAKP